MVEARSRPVRSRPLSIRSYRSGRLTLRKPGPSRHERHDPTAINPATAADFSVRATQSLAANTDPAGTRDALADTSEQPLARPNLRQAIEHPKKRRGLVNARNRERQPGMWRGAELGEPHMDQSKPRPSQQPCDRVPQGVWRRLLPRPRKPSAFPRPRWIPKAQRARGSLRVPACQIVRAPAPPGVCPRAFRLPLTGVPCESVRSRNGGRRRNRPAQSARVPRKDGVSASVAVRLLPARLIPS